MNAVEYLEEIRKESDLLREQREKERDAFLRAMKRRQGAKELDQANGAKK